MSAQLVFKRTRPFTVFVNSVNELCREAVLIVGDVVSPELRYYSPSPQTFG